MCQGIHLVMGLLGQLQIIGEVPFSFLHTVQAVISFASPVEGVGFGLAVVLSEPERAVEITDGLFELCIGECLCAQLE